MTFLDILESTLLKDERFVAEDGKVLKAKVYDAAMAMDESLLRLLLSEPKIKSHFFKDINGTLVFDKVQFAWVLNSREFLPDSYTMYKNKIGLADRRGDIISSKNDVTLVWPYKDCVLEGGQTKEDEIRDEVFYNETLAPDQVTRLLYPKVFCNAKRYSYAGDYDLIGQATGDGNADVKCEPITEFRDDDNLIVKGNNLLALSSLLRRYEGQVKLIYIDPPFNTERDSFNYNDSFNHSTWLTFIQNRLQLAKRLLSPDGSIYVHIDRNESGYLRVLLDDIFGRENLQAEIIWVLEGASGYKSLVNNYVRGHDTIFFYSKSKNMTYNKTYLPYDENQLKRFSSIDEDGRQYKVITRTRRFYLDEAKGVPLTDVWSDIASFQTIVNSPEITGFDTQKPEKLLQRIIACSSNEGDLVLDFHLGSGTTAATAHKMNRRYIGVEQIQSQVEILVNRLKKTVSGDQAGISKDVNWHGGGSFVYCELAERSETLATQLQSATGSDAVLVILDEATDQGLLRPSVMPEDLKKSREEFLQLSLNEQRQLVMELIDKNKLYVNLCDMNDENMGVSEEDKAFTRSFYRLSEESEG
ncbi:MAG: site-specific DNA-methyltransferase [Peptococcia bacterium]|jgi:adenine-specific DNA-methyltransferase